jgi:LPXTG-motif cell wall-anchored protein
MALNSTPRRRFGVALGVVLTGAAAGLIGFTGVAGAHTPVWSAECEGDTTTVKVDLTQYRSEHNNHVKVTDGETVLVDKSFKSSYQETFETSGAVDHVFKLQVTAWDDEKFNKNDTIRVEKCVVETTTETETTTTTTESSQPTSEPSETPTSEPSETPTTSSEAPVTTTTVAPTTTPAQVDDDQLAETGASIGLPLGIAGVLLVGGGVALFIVRRRGKA